MLGLQLRPAMAPAMDSSASSMNVNPSTEGWEQLARDLWPSEAATRNVRPETIKKKIWDPLEAESFASRSLAILESLQILEWYEIGKEQNSAANVPLTRIQVSMACLQR